MKKYYLMYKMSIADMFADTGKTFIWIALEAVIAFVFIFTWIVASEGKDMIGGISKNQIITYYIFVFFFWFVIGGFSSYPIAESIRKGNISNQLLKPILPFSKEILLEQGWKTFGIITSIPLIFLMIFIFIPDFRLEIELKNLLIALPSIPISALIFMAIDICIGTSAFWLNNIGGIRNIVEVGNNLLGGYMIPIALLPASLQSLSKFLPFKYTFSMPVEIIQGRITGEDVLISYLIQFVWLIILLFVAYFFIKLGLRKNESYGG